MKDFSLKACQERARARQAQEAAFIGPRPPRQFRPPLRLRTGGIDQGPSVILYGDGIREQRVPRTDWEYSDRY